MEKVVKQHILSSVFSHLNDDEKCVMDNRRKNGFSVGMNVIPPFIFEKLVEITNYLSEHRVYWYVTTDEFALYSYEVPCIRFFDDDEE